MGDWRSVAKAGKLPAKIGFEKHVPRALRAIINRACSTDGRRFASAAAFRGALQGLRFNHDWVKLSDAEWVSEQGQRAERILRKASRRFEVVYTINNRRNNALCGTFTTESDARDYMLDMVYRTTLA
jgi:eukaryotic-like serine/threonine-protein kinase